MGTTDSDDELVTKWCGLCYQSKHWPHGSVLTSIWPPLIGFLTSCLCKWAIGRLEFTFQESSLDFFDKTLLWMQECLKKKKKRKDSDIGVYLGLEGFPDGSEVKASACVSLQHGRPGFNPWVRKIPWRRKRQPTPVFLPGESHGWRNLVG